MVRLWRMDRVKRTFCVQMLLRQSNGVEAVILSIIPRYQDAHETTEQKTQEMICEYVQMNVYQVYVREKMVNRIY